MCRFVLYKGPPLTIASLVTEPAHSLIAQSTSSREADEPLNGDGFGVGWYVPALSDKPAVFRSVTPAWNNGNLLDLARVTRSHLIMAHVRAATRGLPVTELNCHPFQFGRYAFMHNGDVGGFAHMRRKLLGSLSDTAFGAIKGSTDSEHLFGLFLDEIEKRGEGEGAPRLADALLAAVQRAAALSRESGRNEHSYLNIAVADGKSAVALRWTSDDPAHASSLYLHTGRRYACKDGVCAMIQPEAGQGAVIVSSERLSDDPGWQVINPNHALLIHEDSTVDFRPAA
jgi:glutamine amidotransferase